MSGSEVGGYRNEWIRGGWDPKREDPRWAGSEMSGSEVGGIRNEWIRGGRIRSGGPDAPGSNMASPPASHSAGHNPPPSFLLPFRDTSTRSHGDCHKRAWHAANSHTKVHRGHALAATAFEEVSVGGSGGGDFGVQPNLTTSGRPASASQLRSAPMPILGYSTVHPPHTRHARAAHAARTHHAHAVDSAGV